LKAGKTNYIFDFYGTLLDIHTDEEQQSLWKKTAALYAAAGADYDGAGLRAAYVGMVREEEEKLAAKTGYKFPEIDLRIVFARLLTEAPARHDARFDGLTTGELFGSDWVWSIGQAFRALSRRRMAVYRGTEGVLKRLKARGNRLYLLSNAQSVFTVPELEMSGLKDLFDAVYISSDVGMKKPQKEFMEKLLREQRIDPKSAVMIGNDFSSDIRVAMLNGMDSVHLNTDGYSEEEIQKRILDAGDGIENPVRPRLIRSGRIVSLLEEVWTDAGLA